MKQGNNFDFLRYFFAISVFVVHFCGLSGIDPPSFLSAEISVKMFFIISGILVFYSFIKSPSVKDYTGKRFRRIYPPYVFIILLCVFLGMFLTQQPLSEYLLSKETYKYLIANLGFLNFLQPTLPGVFEDNQMHVVNGSLWTLKIEVAFYVSVPFLYYLLKRYNKLGVVLAVIILSIIYNQTFLYLYSQTDNEFYWFLRKQFFGQFSYFYSGVLILLYFDYFQKHVKYIFPAALFVFFFRHEFFLFYWLEPLALASLVIGFAYNFKYLNFLRKYDNISYGMYLFHFPIIQIVVHYGLVDINPIMAFIVCLLATIILAAFSWRIIEKPILQRGKKRVE